MGREKEGPQENDAEGPRTWRTNLLFPGLAVEKNRQLVGTDRDGQVAIGGEPHAVHESLVLVHAVVPLEGRTLEPVPHHTTSW